jgi:hypothetical protein
LAVPDFGGNQSTPIEGGETLIENFQSNHDCGHRGLYVEFGGLLTAQRAGGHHYFDLFEITALISAADNLIKKAKLAYQPGFFLFNEFLKRPSVRSSLRVRRFACKTRPHCRPRGANQASIALRIYLATAQRAVSVDGRHEDQMTSTLSIKLKSPEEFSTLTRNLW